jgi:hypothetical protein
MRIEQFMYSSRSRRTAQFLLVLMLSEIFLPATAAALTGGPSQPEVQSFEPIGTTEMVDVSSGAFNYNIPLLEVEGYPINLAYHAGQSMDAEASTVGLGWNINPGVVNRNMRGLPDDSNGDVITEESNIKPNTTVGVSSGVDLSNSEVIGLPLGLSGLSMSLGVNYNNYSGVGFEFGVHPHLNMASKLVPGGSANLGLGISSSTTGGTTIAPQLGFGTQADENNADEQQVGLKGSFNRRQGLATLTLDASCTNVTSFLKGALKPKSHLANDAVNMVGSALGSAGASISFGNPTYSPSAQNKMTSLNLGINTKLNPSFVGFDPGLGVNANGYFTTQYIKNQDKTITNKAYGMMYAQNRSKDDLVDFNREKSMSYAKNLTTNLSIPVMTQDVYGVSGQGIGGNYQLKRSEVGVVNDKSVVTVSGGGTIGAEIGVGPPPSVKLGVDLDVNVSTAYGGRWQDGQNESKMGFKSATSALEEPAYFKSVGDLSIESDQNFIDNLGGTEPMRVKLDKTSLASIFDVKTVSTLEGASGPGIAIAYEGIKRTNRERRNQAISYLTAEEANSLSNEYPLQDYTLLLSTVAAPATIAAATTSNLLSRVNTAVTDTKRETKHLSVITTLRNDGVRYVYGVPAYNIKQVEKTFAIGANSSAGTTPVVDLAKGEVTYTATDESKGNIKGIDNYYHSKTLPAFAHSFLLTNVLSADYVDRDLNGPTEDDYGSYTKINYGRASKNYTWRAPYGAGKASYDRGLNANITDDKASYMSGEKEVWNIHSIESKHQIALFYYSPIVGTTAEVRQDGKGAASEILRKLDKIELYTKANYNSAQREPIKTVYFGYDYSLCTGVDNSPVGSGKLTLKTLAFSYGKSNKAKMNPYVFTYPAATNPTATNPTYNPKAYDRWGNYKPNTATATTDNAFTNAAITNADFPYTQQNNTAADITQNNYNAAAWNLSSIKLPSGGTINVQYEASDYAYVQDRKAMEMIKITGIGSSASPTTSVDLYGDAINNFAPNNYIYFDITRVPSNWTSITDKTAWFKNNYINDLQSGYIYFKVLAQLNTLPTNAIKHDYVTGFGELSSYGITDVTPTGAKGYIQLKSISIDDNKYDVPSGSVDIASNSISKAIWNFTRMNYPEIAFNQGTASSLFASLDNPENISLDALSTDIISVVKSLSSAVSQMADFVVGPNRILREGSPVLRPWSGQVGKSIVLGKSWVRLYSPGAKKNGGGYRVKSVTINDGWDAMGAGAGAISATYGQVYDYTTLDTDQKTVISSGVASYEPIMGGDESPFYQPILNNSTTGLLTGLVHPKAQLTMQTLLAGQIGESYFPGPSIVYSKVTVTSLKPTNTTPGVTGTVPTVKRHGTGSIVHEYYTAKDFPVIVKQTDLDAVSRPVPVSDGFAILLNLFKMVNLDYLTASQGYSIETNNMHGQPKTQKVFDENGTEISSVIYEYQKTPDGKLSSTVPVMQANGNVVNQQIGVEIQMIADEQESRNASFSAGIHGNMDFSFIPPFVALTFPSFLPSFNMSDTRFRSITTAKHINRIGILKSTTAIDKGSKVTTENIAYDQETAAVILTKVNNDFEDPIYKFTYPAYWRYKGMGLAYQNLGGGITSSAVGNNVINVSTSILQPGDEILANVSGTQQHLWITTTTPTLAAINNAGDAVEITNLNVQSLKVIRSGYRNLAAMPIGEIVLKTNPINTAGTAWDIPITGSTVLNASATEYAERWQALAASRYYDCNITENISTGFNNIANRVIGPLQDDEWVLSAVPTGTGITPGALATVNRALETWDIGLDNIPPCHPLSPNTITAGTYVYTYNLPAGTTATKLNITKAGVDTGDGLALELINNTTNVITTITVPAAWISTTPPIDVTLTQGNSYSLKATITNSTANQTGFLFAARTMNGTTVLKNVSTGFHNANNAPITAPLDDDWKIIAMPQTATIFPSTIPTAIAATLLPTPALTAPFTPATVKNKYLYTGLWAAPGGLGNWLSPYTEAAGTFIYQRTITIPSNTQGQISIDKIAVDDNINITGITLTSVTPLSGGVVIPPITVPICPSAGCYQTLQTLNYVTPTLPPGDYILSVSTNNNGGPNGLLVIGGITRGRHSPLAFAGQGARMNPYQNGVKGNWRARKAYTYVDERAGLSPTASAASKTRTMGTIANFAPFWLKGGTLNAPTWTATPGSKWQWTEEATQITPDGLALESKDPLGRYNAELLGYDNKIVKATVSNSRRREALYDGFEDYKSTIVQMTGNTGFSSEDNVSHLLLPNNITMSSGSILEFDKTLSHTGTTSLKVTGSVQINMARLADTHEASMEGYRASDPIYENPTYNLSVYDCIYPFAPKSELHKVIVSAWVYGGATISLSNDKRNGCGFPITQSPLWTQTLNVSGTAIEGWQRIYQVVELPEGNNVYLNMAGSGVYIDDLRIMPYDANMKSYVYDNVNFKLRAELDANNYATFYEYDQSGALARVKRETERGIITVKESRSSLKK